MWKQYSRINYPNKRVLKYCELIIYMCLVVMRFNMQDIFEK